jgi:NAD(P)H dehydrogenase (quinone)
LNTLLVVAHPRRASLTFTVATVLARELERCGSRVEWADLVREGFDPVLAPEDEPDWGHPDKRYSAAVHAEMARIERNDATLLVFPVWWWSMPALLKGWIDRVWNNGWAYGGRSYPHRRVWMVGIAGVSAEDYGKHGYDAAMRTQLDLGVLGYCEIPDRRLELLYGSLEGAAPVKEVLGRAAAIARQFAGS